MQKHILKASTKVTRLRWAQEHLNWSSEMWSRVVFSDESKFKLHVGDGRLLVRRNPGERLSDACIQEVPNKTEGITVCVALVEVVWVNLRLLTEKLTQMYT